MKLNKKTKAAIIVLIVAVVIDMWRDWKWSKSVKAYYEQMFGGRGTPDKE